MVRVEYRMPMPKNKLVFVHYLNAGSPGLDFDNLLWLPQQQQQQSQTIRTDRVSSASLQPSSSALSRQPEAIRPSPIPSHPRQINRHVPERKPPVSKVPHRPPADELPEMLNGMEAT